MRDKAYKITSDPRYDFYQRILVSMVCKFFGKKYVGGDAVTNESISSQQQLANKLEI